MTDLMIPNPNYTIALSAAYIAPNTVPCTYRHQRLHLRPAGHQPSGLAVALLVLSLAITSAPALAQQLPPCNLDSFVYQAGAQAELIYGDEGSISIPPLFGYAPDSRIDAGIQGINDYGLTTGQGSMMPSATGADEFLGAEWVNTAAHGAARVLGDPTDGLNLSSQITNLENEELSIEGNKKLSQAAKNQLLNQDMTQLNKEMSEAEKKAALF